MLSTTPRVVAADASPAPQGSHKEAMVPRRQSAIRGDTCIGSYSPVRGRGVSRSAVGFTLIEMLVVIAIISILAGMLFPVFAQARESARKALCLSNVKQLAAAVMMYAADYGDRFPLSAYRTASGQPAPDSPIWPAYIAEYVGNKDIFTCPDCGDETCYADVWADRGRLSIGLNRDLENRTTNTPYPASVFADPSRTILLADSTPGDTDSAKARGFQVIADRAPDTQSAIASRHLKGTNIGFADGHAGWYKAEAVWQLENPAGLLWQPWQQ